MTFCLDAGLTRYAKCDSLIISLILDLRLSGGIEIIIGQEDFYAIFGEAQELKSGGKFADRYIARKFRQYISSNEYDLRQYAQVLLLSFLARPKRIVLNRNTAFYRKNRSKYCRFILDVKPFEYDKQNSNEILVNEQHLIKPLVLKSYLSRKFYSDVEFSYFRFGCLEVEFFIPNLPRNWVNELSEDADFEKARESLQIIYYS